MAIYLSLLVLLVGFVMYLVCAKPEAKELGRIMFFCGLFTWLLKDAAKMLELAK